MQKLAEKWLSKVEYYIWLPDREGIDADTREAQAVFRWLLAQGKVTAKKTEYGTIFTPIR